jgi:hypothetical protein
LIERKNGCKGKPFDEEREAFAAVFNKIYYSRLIITIINLADKK